MGLFTLNPEEPLICWELMTCLQPVCVEAFFPAGWLCDMPPLRSDILSIACDFTEVMGLIRGRGRRADITHQTKALSPAGSVNLRRFVDSSRGLSEVNISCSTFAAR